MATDHVGKHKMAFAGFRHGHIKCLYANALKHSAIDVVAACEENPQEAGGLIADVALTHHDFERMLTDVACDSVAIGDYYGARGSLLVRALKAGKHVILDKPICVTLSELAEAEALASAKGLKIGCMLDLRQQPNLVKVREIVKSGQLGEIAAISFGGQHPLMRGTRPAWYFEEGKHGGTINDIAIHGIDIIEWITGQRFVEVNAARTWAVHNRGGAFFKDAAQFMLKMGNGCGVLGDVSYLSPDSCQYGLPYYWNFIFWGTQGVVRATINADTIEIACDGDKGVRHLPGASNLPPDYLEQFLMDINGTPQDLDTKTVIDVTRKTLTIQAAADAGMPGVEL